MGKMELDKQEEFLKLLEPLHDRLNKFVRAMNYNREDAKDIISETILRAYENFHKLKSHEAFLGYLFTIAYRTNIKYRRGRRFFSLWEDSGAWQVPVKFDPDKNMEVEELYKALGKLPEKQKQAVILFEISGFSISEIATIQGSGISAVKSRLKRGREKLIDIINNDERYFFLGQAEFHASRDSEMPFDIINKKEVFNYQVSK